MITLGYVKDCLAFIAAAVCLSLVNVFKITPHTKVLLPAGLFLILIVDGIFTVFPNLHNLELKPPN